MFSHPLPHFVVSLLPHNKQNGTIWQTDHFDAPATPMLKFWIRGSSVAFLGATYALARLPVDDACSFALAMCAGSAVLYPYNAKFNLIGGEKLPVKYPMHYVPEVLLGALTLVGIKVVFF